MYSYGKFRLYFNVIVLLLSVSSLFFVVLVWRILEFDILLSYILSTFVSFFCLYYLKHALLKRHSSGVAEPIEVEKVGNDSGRRETVQLLIVLLSILIVPMVILFFVPRLWFLVLAGIVSGAAASDLVLVFQGEG